MKRIWALGLAMVLLACSGFVTLAAANGNDVQPQDSHSHIFTECRRANAGFSVERGTCVYLYSTDQNGNPTYRDDCVISDQYQWCNYYCTICHKQDDTQGAHPHFLRTVHSKNHS